MKKQSLCNWIFILPLVIVFLSQQSHAQYFGRNKVQYESFDFKILQSENFEIYYYPAERDPVDDVARILERWNYRFERVFNHKLTKSQPLILYANHADFQQTNAIRGIISQGTGGVTEGAKNRIVLPMTGIYQDNNHVLGHELVHAFQFDIMKALTRRMERSGRMPLWFIEGMAEYLSIGRKDPLTAMWLRDAVYHDKVPSIRELSQDPRYFPYRWGHSVWTYIASKYDDKAVGLLFKQVAATGMEKGFKDALKISVDSLSKEWNEEMIEIYKPQLQDRLAASEFAEPLLTGGQGTNLSPSFSPYGKYVAFLSRRDIFTMDLYLADAQTGKILKKLVSSNSDAHFDAVRFLDSAGAWSPEGKKLAFVVFKKGDNAIAILDVLSQEVERTIKIKGVDALLNIAWSPDGQKLAVSGIKGGINDLYIYNFDEDSLTRLTNDRYAEIQPSWSPDGTKIAMVTERGPDTDFDALKFGVMKIGVYDLSSGDIELISMNGSCKHIDPQFGPDGENLYFIADPEGFSDLFRYSFKDDDFTQLTRINTGISSLTELDQGFLQNALEDPLDGLPRRTDFKRRDYDPSLQLISIGQTGIGVGVDRFGTAIGGSVNFLFSDMLGNQWLGLAAVANGGITDLGGQAQYMRIKNRLNWGAIAGHIPYTTASVFSGVDTVTVDGETVLAQRRDFIRQRVFVDRISPIVEYPLSTNRRFEFAAGYTRYSYDIERETVFTAGGFVLDREEEDLDGPAPLNLFHTSAAYVGDYSYFGFTAPVKGKRFRIEVEPRFGSIRFLTTLLDYRQYYFWNPFTLAFRGFHFGRYLKDAESERLSPVYLGQETFVRGYSIGSIDLGECTETGDPNQCPEVDRLIGSKIAVFNAEFRVPLFGVEQFGLINFPYLPTDLVLFFDGGVAWTDDENPKFEFTAESTKRIPVFSAGIAARVNLLGYLVTQFYYAFPFQRPNKTAQFGFVIAPGW